MIYKKFYFKNYKGIKDKVEIDIDANSKKPYCIIGNNESGKTTILKGINIIGRLCCGDKLNDDETSEIKPNIDYWTGEIELSTIISYKSNEIEEQFLHTNKEDDNKIDICFCLSYKKGIYQGIKKNISLNGVMITEEKKQKQFYQAIKKYSQEIVYYEDFMFEIPNYILYQKNKNIKIKDENKLLQLKSPSNKFWQEVLDNLIKGAYNDNTMNFKDDFVYYDYEKNKTPSALPKMSQFLTERIGSWSKNKDSNIKMIRIEEDRNDEEVVKYYIRILTDNENGYNIKERSKGFQWSFCFTTLTEIKKYKNENGFIFLLDEPASNLHIASQSEMLEKMSNLCENKNIAIYSTHAPDLIDINNINNMFVVKNNASEMEDTSIILASFQQQEFPNGITLTDIEVLIARFVYQGVKSISIDEKGHSKWDDIIKFFTNSKVERATNIFSNLANIFSKFPLLKNLFKNLFS